MEYLDDNDSLRASKQSEMVTGMSLYRYTGHVEKHPQPLWKLGRASRGETPCAEPLRLNRLRVQRLVG